MAVSKAKDYAQIAKRNITSPSELKDRRLPRILVYGRNKKGKTRFMMSVGQGDILILDPEHGTDEMTKLDPHVWHITEWEELDDAYKFLKLGNHSYKWVGVDGMTKIHNMALRWVMSQAEEADLTRKPGLVQQRDYGRANEMVKGMMWNFHNLSMGVIFSAQERMEKSESTDDDDADVEESAAAFVPDLPKGARSTLNSIVSVIGRIYTVKATIKVRVDGKIVEKENAVQRRLWLEPHPSYDTGYRSEYELPKYIANPTVPKLVNLIRTGKARA